MKAPFRVAIWALGPYFALGALSCSSPLKRPNLPPPEYEARPQEPYEVAVRETPLEAALSSKSDGPRAASEKMPLDVRVAKSQRALDAGVRPESDDQNARNNEESYPAPASSLQ